jgi:hypothetical protein
MGYPHLLSKMTQRSTHQHQGIDQPDHHSCYNEFIGLKQVITLFASTPEPTKTGLPESKALWLANK